MTIKEFVETSESFDRYRKDCVWQGFTVYEVWEKRNEGACVGYPQFALEKDGKIRLSTLEETIAIMDATIVPDNEEETV